MASVLGGRSPVFRQVGPVLLVVFGLACGDAGIAPIPPDGALFEVLACRGSPPTVQGERFGVRITEPAVVAQATVRIGLGRGLILGGQTVAGDGGFNQPWDWHHHPGSIWFAQQTIELCDGCPSSIGAGIQFCPWSTEVLQRLE